ncbi:TPA: glycosyltransferase [Streptococcus suis]
MGLIFAHDHKFRFVDGCYYSTGGLSNDVLTRYVNIFGKVTVIARVINESNVGERYSAIENPNVQIIERRLLTKADVLKMVSENEYIIARLPSKIGSEIAQYAQKLRKKYLVEMVGCPWDALFNHSIRGKVVALPMYLITKQQVKEASYVLYVTEKFLQNRYPTKGNMVGCSDVVINDCDDAVLEKRIQHINNQSGKIIIGTTAAVDVRYKGQEYIIRAIAALKKKGITHFEYQLVGNGNLEYLSQIAAENNVEDMVTFVGGLPHNKVFEWLDTIDIYAQPSKVEGLPRAVVEAMSRALPCIGSRKGGIPELLDEDCLFLSTNINEIVEILKGANTNWMKKKAISSIEKAKLYDKAKLDEKRNRFYEEFKKCVDNAK